MLTVFELCKKKQTLLPYYFIKSEVFYQLNRAVELNLESKIPEKLPSVAKKGLLQKKLKDIISALPSSLRLLKPLNKLFWEQFKKSQLGA